MMSSLPPTLVYHTSPAVWRPPIRLLDKLNIRLTPGCCQLVQPCVCARHRGHGRPTVFRPAGRTWHASSLADEPSKRHWACALTAGRGSGPSRRSSPGHSARCLAACSVLRRPKAGYQDQASDPTRRKEEADKKGTKHGRDHGLFVLLPSLPLCFFLCVCDARGQKDRGGQPTCVLSASCISQLGRHKSRQKGLFWGLLEGLAPGRGRRPTLTFLRGKPRGHRAVCADWLDRDRDAPQGRERGASPRRDSCVARARNRQKCSVRCRAVF